MNSEASSAGSLSIGSGSNFAPWFERLISSVSSGTAAGSVSANDTLLSSSAPSSAIIISGFEVSCTLLLERSFKRYSSSKDVPSTSFWVIPSARISASGLTAFSSSSSSRIKSSIMSEFFSLSALSSLSFLS